MKRLSGKQLLSGAGLILAGVALAIGLSSPGSRHAAAQPGVERGLAPLASGNLKQRFAVLSRQHSNQCGLAGADFSALARNGRLQGSCCGAMVYDEYVRQINGLKRYATVPEVPADPYDISVGQAAQLVGYDRSITLTPSQQQVYDQAKKLSHEHGPCCCHCWRWTAFNGQAKALIARRRYGAAQIAAIWNLDDGCGGGSGPMMMS
jgi:hypothetical protein